MTIIYFYEYKLDSVIFETDFDEITDHFDENNEFTFDLTGKKVLSIYGEKFKLVLGSIRYEWGDELSYRFSSKNFSRDFLAKDGLEVRFNIKNNSKTYALITKNADIKNRKATFTIKEITNLNDIYNGNTNFLNWIKSKVFDTEAPITIIDANRLQDANYELIWKKKFGTEILDADISSDGKTIAFISGIMKNDGSTTTIYILDDKGESIWFSDTLAIRDISLSPEGECLAMTTSGKVYLYPNSIKAPLYRTSDQLDVSVSSNCDLISFFGIYGQHKVILINKKGEELWNFQMNIPKKRNQIGSIFISSRGKYIAAANWEDSGIVVYLLNKDGKLIWKKGGKTKFETSMFEMASFSRNGKYIVASDPYKIYFLDINGTILNSYIFPYNFPENVGIRKVLVADSGAIGAFVNDWRAEKTNSSVYLINKNGSLLWKRDFDNKINALAISSHGYHILIGTNNGDLYYFARSDVGEEPVEVEQEIEKENPMNLTFIIVGVLAFGFISLFIALPYYKRAKLKREMAKTPTDWCPHCKKFTGGAKTCPHCGKQTLVSVTYDKSKKVKKK